MKKNQFESIKKRARAKKVKSLKFIWGKNLTFFLLFFLITLSFFFQLILANDLSTKGGEIKSLENGKNRLIYEISLLENEKSKLNSLSRIKSEAEETLKMNFDISSFEYLEDPNVAYKE